MKAIYIHMRWAKREVRNLFTLVNIFPHDNAQQVNFAARRKQEPKTHAIQEVMRGHRVDQAHVNSRDSSTDKLNLH
jgi:hypothetical protein